VKTFLILGAGAGGTMVANKMAKLLDPQEWKIVVVDPDPIIITNRDFCLYHLVFIPLQNW
jgi:NADH dehydrogenase FAD-containing subunit